MVKMSIERTASIVVLMAFVILLAACGGSDDDATDDMADLADAEATETPVIEEETPTPEPTPSPTAEPTPEPTPTPEATATPEPTPEPSPTATVEPDPDVEDGDLLDYLLQPEDFPAGWVLIGSRESTAFDPPCEIDPLPDELFWAPTVEADFEDESSDAEELFSQLLTRYETVDDAVEAMDWYRAGWTCPEWEDVDGTVWTPSDVPIADIGDETIAKEISYVEDGVPLNIVFVIIRQERHIVLLGQLTTGDVDVAFIDEMTQSAISRLSE